MSTGDINNGRWVLLIRAPLPTARRSSPRLAAIDRAGDVIRQDMLAGGRHLKKQCSCGLTNTTTPAIGKATSVRRC